MKFALSWEMQIDWRVIHRQPRVLIVSSIIQVDENPSQLALMADPMSPLMSRVDLMSLAKLVVRALGLGLGNSMFSIYKGMFLRGQQTDDDGD